MPFGGSSTLQCSVFAMLLGELTLVLGCTPRPVFLALGMLMPFPVALLRQGMDLSQRGSQLLLQLLVLPLQALERLSTFFH